jgi:hypothetical protein
MLDCAPCARKLYTGSRVNLTLRCDWPTKFCGISTVLTTGNVGVEMSAGTFPTRGRLTLLNEEGL